MATAAAVIIAVVAAVGTNVQRIKVRKEQRIQNQLNNKISAITRQRNIKRSIATQRIRVAQQQALGFQLGVAEGSAVQGASAGVIGDLATSIGQSNLQLTGQQFNVASQDRASRAQGAAESFRAAGSLATSLSLAGSPQTTAALTSLVN